MSLKWLLNLVNTRIRVVLLFWKITLLHKKVYWYIPSPKKFLQKNNPYQISIPSLSIKKKKKTGYKNAQDPLIIEQISEKCCKDRKIKVSEPYCTLSSLYHCIHIVTLSCADPNFFKINYRITKNMPQSPLANSNSHRTLW